MAQPLSASTAERALRAAVARVATVPGWQTHNRAGHGAWGPVHGVVIHHTVTKGAAQTVSICHDGYSGLPGPLCHGVVTKDGTVTLVGWGRANHAGLGDRDVLEAVIAERTPFPKPNANEVDGNSRFYGFELENLGDGKDPWPEVQVDAAARAAAALCKAHGWTEKSVIGHKEWQVGKPDPSGPGFGSMDDFRARVRAHLTGKAPAPKPPAPAPKTLEQRVAALEAAVFKK